MACLVEGEAACVTALQHHPDGGCYGWMVVIASFVCNIFVLGVHQAIGPVFVALEKDFGAGSESTSMIISLMLLFQFGCGPIANVSVRKYGHRVTVMIGSFISSAGYLLSSYAPSIEVVNVTFGVLVGFGYAFIFGPCLGIVALYVKKRYVLANSMAVMGSSVGALALGPMLQFLINTYGWRETLFLFAGVNLQMCICALFFKTPENTSDNTSDHSQTTDLSIKGRSSRIRKVCEQLDLNFFIKNKQYVVYVVVLFVGIGLGIFGTLPHWYARAQALQLAPSQQLSFLISVFAIGGIVGRLAPNCMACINSMYLFGFTVYFTGVLSIVSGFMETYASYAVYVALLGFSNGVMTTLESQVLRDIVGHQKVTAAIGLATPFMGIGAFIGPIVAGFIYDQTGDYDNSFYFYGVCSVPAGLLVVVVDPFVRPDRGRSRNAMSPK
ncbi:monocarboxylate transporter 3-like [Ptychodera flava]|uniref:monocarboxylate transporter 3-like n=1 Tax=Ptychodera flava TaxID=63121 RepID=UPI00396A45D9